MISAIAFKVALTALVIFIVVLCLDDANGTYNKSTSPMWIALPGAVAGVVMLGGFIVGVCALVWGL